MKQLSHKFSLIIFIISFALFFNTLFVEQALPQTPRIMQGPMVGAVSEESVSIWIRTSGPYSCFMELDQDPDFSKPLKSNSVTTSKESDYCTTLQVQHLKPGTKYYYRIFIEGEIDPYLKKQEPFFCRTAPPSDQPVRFTVAYGSCARFQDDRIQKIWTAVANRHPDLFFWIGDNVYADTLDPDILAEEYRRQRDVAPLQPLLRTIPQLAIWDDHDFMVNNSDRTNPVKKDALKVFQRYWANPRYGLPETPGCFFHYSYGGVDFFFLDDRYYRDPNNAPDTPQKTHLGETQLAWLKKGLLSSRAPFKIILSGGGWSVAKGPGGDSWSAFLHERNAIFNFIRDQKIEGVVFLSGDTHVGELNAIPWSEKGGYDYYDLCSSPLAQQPSRGWIERRPEIRIRPVYYSAANAGIVTFTIGDDPSMKFELINELGYSVWQPLILYARELQNGIQTWDKKIDPDSMRRLLRYKEGKAYYKD